MKYSDPRGRVIAGKITDVVSPPPGESAGDRGADIVVVDSASDASDDGARTWIVDCGGSDVVVVLHQASVKAATAATVSTANTSLDLGLTVALSDDTDSPDSFCGHGCYRAVASMGLPPVDRKVSPDSAHRRMLRICGASSDLAR